VTWSSHAADTQKARKIYHDLVTEDSAKSYQTAKKIMEEQREMHLFLMKQVHEAIKRREIPLIIGSTPEDYKLAFSFVNSVQLLGDLRVAESAPLLVEAMDVTIRCSSSPCPRARPADALVKIGLPSVPPLMKALQKTDWGHFLIYLGILRQIVGEDELKRLILPWKCNPAPTNPECQFSDLYEIAIKLMETDLNLENRATHEKLNQIVISHFKNKKAATDKGQPLPEPKTD
jgi:hypothetical protein